MKWCLLAACALGEVTNAPFALNTVEADFCGCEMGELEVVYECVAKKVEDGGCERWFFGDRMGATGDTEINYETTTGAKPVSTFYFPVTPKEELYLHEVAFPLSGDLASCQPTKVGTASQGTDGKFVPNEPLTDMTKTVITLSDGVCTITVPESVAPSFKPPTSSTYVAVGLPDECFKPTNDFATLVTVTAVLRGSDLTPLPTTTPDTDHASSTLPALALLTPLFILNV